MGQELKKIGACSAIFITFYVSVSLPREYFFGKHPDLPAESKPIGTYFSDLVVASSSGTTTITASVTQLMNALATKKLGQ